MLFEIAGYIHCSDGDAGMRILRNSRAAIIDMQPSGAELSCR